MPMVGPDGSSQRSGTVIRVFQVRYPLLSSATNESGTRVDELFAVSASVGVAIYPRDGDTVVDLLRNSDVAMYSVKAQGRNGASIYSPQLAGRSSRDFASSGFQRFSNADL